MKNAMKKLMAFVLVAVMLVSAVPTAFATETFTVTVVFDGGNKPETAVSATSGDTVASVYTKAAGQAGIDTSVFVPNSYTWDSTTYPNTPTAGDAPVMETGRLTAHLSVRSTHTHVFDQEEVIQNATCGAHGSKLQTCTACGATQTATINATGNHTYAADAKCDEAAKCANCTYTRPAGSHTEGAAATCTTPQICTVCNEVLVPATGHHYTTAATCTTPAKCACGAVNGTALNHNWVEDPTQYVAPKCIDTGKKVFVCTNSTCPVDGKSYTETLNALGHAPGANGKCTRSGCTYEETASYVLNFCLNYDDNFGFTAKGAYKGDGIYNVYTPTRYGYTFVGWYTDSALTNRVSESAIVTGPGSYYAKWEQIAPHEVYVNVYINGNTKSTYAIVDLYGYAQDGVITKADIESAVKNYGLKAYNAAGLQVHGLFTPAEWAKYCADDYSRYGLERVAVDKTAKTVLYTMVHNVDTNVGSSSSSSSKADSTNPKTGDMIFAPMIVMGASASCLAVLYYLNKKRAI